MKMRMDAEQVNKSFEVARDRNVELSEYDARIILWNAANYLYANQIGIPARTQAMDMLDDIRRDWANWRDLSEHHGVQYRVVFSKNSAAPVTTK
jgi:hypothetical protein